MCLALENEDRDTLIHSGATFADLQLLPNLGAWHGSECKSAYPVIWPGTLESL